MYKRCEMILKELENEGKLKVWWDFKFPEKEPLKLRLKDMLEEQVDEKYYLSDMQVNKIQTSEFMQEKKRIQEKDYSDTILARDWKDPKCVRIGNIYGEDKGTGYAGNVWDKENLSPTLTNMQGGNRQPMILEDFYKNRPVREYEEVAPTLRSERIGLKVVEPQIITHNIQQEEKILVKNATKKGYDEAIDGDSINLSYPESTTRRGRVGHGVAQTLQCNDSIGVVETKLPGAYGRNYGSKGKIQDAENICDTLQAAMGNGGGNVPILEEPAIQVLGNYMPSNHDASRIVDSDGLAPTVKENHGTVTATNTGLRIRKLTPCECWKLMGFDIEDFEKAKNALNEKFYKGKDKSSSQLYKQAGNSIVVNVLEKIFKNLLEG